MFVRAALIASVALALVSFARPAQALPLCEEGHDDDDDNGKPALAVVEEAAQVLEHERVILPCALAETAFGCADAAIYVVTNSGTLLCQIDIPALAALSGQEQVERAPAAPAASVAAAFTALALPTKTVGLPPVIAFDVPRAADTLVGSERDGHTWSTSPPS